MTIATLICAGLSCIGACLAQTAAPPAIACNPNAISAAERPRYNDLMKRLHASARSRNELPDGYVYKLDGKAITLRDVAEWMGLERLCCPFLTLQLSASGNHNDWSLTLTGPPGVKALLP